MRENANSALMGREPVAWWHRALIDYLGPCLAIFTFVTVGGLIYYAHKVTQEEIKRSAPPPPPSSRTPATFESCAPPWRPACGEEQASTSPPVRK